MLADGAAKLFALLRILPGFINRSPRNAIRHCCDLNFLNIQCAPGKKFPPFIPTLGSADDGVFIQFYIVKENIHRRRIA